MRLLICGLGSIGRRHLQNLLALGQTDIVLYRTGRATLDDDELRDFPVESDLQQALERWNPDAAIISNPTAMHVETALPLARAGCALLMEKPISHSLQGLDEFKEALQEKQTPFLVGFQFRFHPGLQAVKRLLNERAIGRVISVTAYWGEYLPSWHPWEDYRLSYSAHADLGGGVLLTLCHPFDYLRWLIGEVDSVMAESRASGILEIEVEDIAEVSLIFLNGALGHVHLDYLSRPIRHDLEVIGSQGKIRWDNADGAVHYWTADSQSWNTIEAPPGFERNVMFLEEMRHFLDVMQGNTRPICGFEEGLRALELILAAQRSAHQGQRIKL